MQGTTPAEPASERPTPHAHGIRLLVGFIIYYAVVTGIVVAAVFIWPDLRHFLPIGGAEALISQGQPNLLRGANIEATHVRSFGESLLWLGTATAGALLTALPVSRIYLEVRDRQEYDQSLVDTIVVLPVVVTGIVVVVQHSLALAFSIAGVAGAVRFRNSLKSSGDALFILLGVAIGLSAGIGAIELALVMSIAFNLTFVALWVSGYGARQSMKRYLCDFRKPDGGPAVAAADGESS